MSYLNERVAYLKGLAEGMEVETNTKEGKLFTSIINVLEDFADEIEEINVDFDELDEYVEAIDEDLMDLEEDVYEEEDLDDEIEDLEDFEEIECPTCGEEIYVDEDFMCDNDNCEVKIECPNCEQTIFLTDEGSFSEEEEK